MRPEARRVEGGDVAAALLLRVELGGQPVGVGALAHEVVARLARRSRAHARHAFFVVRQWRVEQHHPGREALGEPEREVLDHRTAEIAADEHDALVAEVIVHERVQVARMAGDVVEAVRGDVGVAEPAQVGNDDLEARLGERLDHAPPDALRLGPAVDEQQRPGAAGFSWDERLIGTRRS